MLVYKNCVTYLLLDDLVDIYSEETDYGFNTVVELNKEFHYVGNAPPTLETAINVWQQEYGRLMTYNELIKVVIQNEELEKQNGNNENDKEGSKEGDEEDCEESSKEDCEESFEEGCIEEVDQEGNEGSRQN